VLSRTAKEDDGCDDTHAEADTAASRGTKKKNNNKSNVLAQKATRTHDFTSKSATGTAHIQNHELGENIG